MQINSIDNTNFKAINSTNAQNLLFSRLSTPKKFLKYEYFMRNQAKKTYDIILEQGEKEVLYATVVDKNGVKLFTERESFVSRLLKMSPLRFLKNISKKADTKV